MSYCLAHIFDSAIDTERDLVFGSHRWGYDRSISYKDHPHSKSELKHKKNILSPEHVKNEIMRAENGNDNDL